jgi:TusA-related sulfurtransferase
MKQPVAQLDVRAHVCPMTYVYTKLRLEALRPGELLEVLVRGEAPLRNIPRSAREEGHVVLKTEPMENDCHRILIEKHERT